MAAAGHDVAFIARGAHRDAIRANGLFVESPLGDLHLKDVNATNDPHAVGPVDVVLFAVKLWDTEAAAEQTRPMVGPDTRVITLQNGVDSVARIAPILGTDTVIGGSTYIVTTIAEPGVIRHSGPRAQIVCGRLDGRDDDTLNRYADAFKAAGIDFSVTATMNTDMWKKFVLLSGTSGITASTRRPIGDILADPDMKALFLKLMSEAVAVGRASGVDLPASYADEQLKTAQGFPPTMRASMANDLNNGNRLELDWLAGKVVELGHKLGVPVPASEVIYAVLKPYRMGRPD
jgi:2-dehydropantoate 2-reductase